MNFDRFATLPHPLKEDGKRAEDGQREGTPSLGSGVSFLSAINLTSDTPQPPLKE